MEDRTPRTFWRYLLFLHSLYWKIQRRPQPFNAFLLGAATGDYGPGPLVSALVNKVSGVLRIPVTVVPGSLSQADIAAIT